MDSTITVLVWPCFSKIQLCGFEVCITRFLCDPSFCILASIYDLSVSLNVQYPFILACNMLQNIKHDELKFNTLSIGIYTLLPQNYIQNLGIVLQGIVLYLVQTACTGEFFLWIIRWAQHSIAASFNMKQQSTISIRSAAWQ